MFKQILKQLWAQRRSNSWILLELIVVTAAIWWVIDPLYVIRCNQTIPQGFDCTDVYRITLGELPKKSPAYKAEESDSVNALVNFNRIVDRIKQYPGVEASVVIRYYYPFSDSNSSSSYHYKSIEANAWNMGYYSAGDYFQVFRYTSAADHSWQNLAKIKINANDVFITKDIEKKMFGNKSALGKKLTGDDSTNVYTVVGVLDYVKLISSGQPQPIIISPEMKMNQTSSINEVKIFIRMKKGTAEKPFLEAFKKQMFSDLSIGNYYLTEINSYDRIKTDYEYSRGITNILRIKTGLCIFFLVNILLGVVGTFWLKCRARRDEIGLRMVLGSTREELHKFFITEGWLLTTLAFIIGIIINLQFIYFNGFYQTDQNNETGIPWVNNACIHFAAVSLIVYVLLLVTVLLATWLPVSAACKVSPVDVLRDE